MSLTSFSFVISNNEKELLIKNSSLTRLPVPTQYIDFYFSINDCKITIYKNLKCLVQGKSASKVILNYFPNHINVLNQEDLNSKSQVKTIHNQGNIIGSDEVGVGDYFGGICVCAVFLNNSDVEKLIKLGVKDSKKLDDKKIVSIANELIKFVKYKVKNIFPEKYNILYKQYKNTHIIKTLAHYKCLKELSEDVKKIPNTSFKIVIDEYASEKKFNEYLKILNINNNLNTKIIFETHAEEKYLAIAAASILARYFFLKQISDLSNQLEVNLPLGAWNDNIEKTILNILKPLKTNNKEIDLLLNKYVKKHFSNTKKVLEKLH